MNVSISTVAKDLNTTIPGMQAAITLYALTMAAFMLTGGKLGDIWGRHQAFRIGSIIYGIGSLITALSPSLAVLLFGWSLVEGLGAVLVIPAIAALAAANYSGRDRIAAFSILGAVTGLAAAVGPIVGGFMTTYLSWRYVFAAETIIMIGVLLVSHKIGDTKIARKPKLDIPSVFLSAAGMGLLVFGILQSKTWGLIVPTSSPTVDGQLIAPFGISIVAYLILAGIIILMAFMARQRKLEAENRNALLKASLLKKSVLRSGLAVFMSQYFVIASLFFIVPVYLQMILGYDALTTGIKLLPLSIGLILFSAIGSRMSEKRAARQIARVGQIALAFGSLLILASIDPQLENTLFWLGMFTIGAGFGLLASQLGNVNMSVVGPADTAEVGGLQGTFQNLGTSFGTAVVGSIFIIALSSGFVNAINDNPNLDNATKTKITDAAQTTSVPIVSPAQAEKYVISAGGNQQTADEVSETYENAQLKALQQATFFIFIAALLSLVFSRNLPSKS